MRHSRLDAESLVERVAKLLTAPDRVEAAKELAASLGGADLLLFVNDLELGVPLPAIGFPQTLSARSGWRELVAVAKRERVARGEMTSPYTGERTAAVAVAGGDAILVLLGASEAPAGSLKPLLALLGHALALERHNSTVQGELVVSRDAVREAGSLAAQLDVARRYLERRVRERTLEIEKAVEEMTGFTYTVAHDLRAPLRAIVATSSILLDELGPGVDEEHQEMLRRQIYNGNRLGTLIDELLKLSRLSRQEMRRVPLDLSKIAQETAEMVLADHPGTVATIVVQPSMTANADPSLVGLLLQNLLDNAVKFSPRGGAIEIGQKGAVVTVRDHGVGFDMSYVHKIFLPFERLVGIEEIPGTGIGLANVKRIVERHGGKIWAESEIGKGTAISLTLGS